MNLSLPRIYPITDKALAGRDSHLSILKELIRGGARLVQIRDKQTPLSELLADLLRCVEFACKHEAVLIVNDRCDLALSVGAGGVHLGQHDLPPEAARKVLGPRKVIGYSTHTIGQVKLAMRLPVHYIGFGPIYDTSTKPDPSPVVGLQGLTRACRISVKPVVAIGGISQERVAQVLEAGAASAAIISALMKAKNLARQMEEMLKTARETG
jgi:thiamine-phosphate pyrophosphorylase